VVRRPRPAAYYPPSWAFGVVWPILYALIGAAAALVYLGGREGREDALTGQHGSPATPESRSGCSAPSSPSTSRGRPSWGGLERADLGLVVLGLLLPLVVATIVAFDRVDRRAALLLVPYLAWVCFATALNYGIWALN